MYRKDPFAYLGRCLQRPYQLRGQVRSIGRLLGYYSRYSTLCESQMAAQSRQ